MTYLMNPHTGSVDTLENWKDDFNSCPEDERELAGWAKNFEDCDLVEVVRNVNGENGYDANYGEWRPL